MSSSRLDHLFRLYINRECTRKEKQELMEMLADPTNELEVQSLIDQVIQNTGSERKLPEPAADFMLQNILSSPKSIELPAKTTRLQFIKKLQVAAAVILFMIVGSLIIINRKPAKSLVNLNKRPSTGQPGAIKASLILADGSVIKLEDMKRSIKQGSTLISNAHGVLVYNAASASTSNTTLVYNTLSTPRGGSYEIVLPDGSKVWLNAASTIRYATAFNGKKREVELTGEAYFEVARNKKKPFSIKAGSMKIEVLGTHFNVNAYEEEAAIKTSLVEGSVKIIKDGRTDILIPGQQAILDKKKNSVEISAADISKETAWKQGFFEFDGADFSNIMRQIGRWYDVEIIFTGQVPQRSFQGKISRNAELSDALQILELSDIKFHQEGRKIYIQ